ncbi:MAG: hypothetical protein OJF60_002878 [Burkholderiaceae bacterium]|nr:MAG: hypothetical protein OJF60_002878 [Burkholderiaceae bacterium]
MSATRRLFLGLFASAVLLAGCASGPTGQNAAPILFVHGNGDSAAVWQTTIWRFESNGWPADRLTAINVPYPLARDDDSKPQAGRSSTFENMAYLRAAVAKVRKTTGASKVILVGNSRGGNTIRNYIQNGGGAETVSEAILGGTPNHGVWAIKGFNEGNEFSGTGPFLTGLNAPKDPNGDEVTPGVKWMTIRSDHNDKYAQPDGLWIGAKGKPTGVTYDGPALKGATNVVIPGVDHRGTAFSPAAFGAMYGFITGHPARTLDPVVQATPVLSGEITGLGVNSNDPASGNFSNNLPLPGAKLAIYATNPATGERIGAASYSKTITADGRWGPFTAAAGVPYEFVISATGYATTHIYRSPFPRSSNIVDMHPVRLAAADRGAGSVITFERPRGYFDAMRDRVSFDGHTPPPGVPPAGVAGVSSSTIKTAAASEVRAITGQLDGERITGRTWPAAEGNAVVLELTN